MASSLSKSIGIVFPLAFLTVFAGRHRVRQQKGPPCSGLLKRRFTPVQCEVHSSKTSDPFGRFCSQSQSDDSTLPAGMPAG